MKSQAKADSLIRKIKEELSFRLANSASLDTIREFRDSEGYPCLMLSDGGNEAAGQPVIFLRAKAADAVSKDIFGNDLDALAPHAIDLAYELDGTSTEPSALDLAKVQHAAGRLGAKLQIRQIADGTAVTAANADAAAIAASLEFELSWPTKGV